MLTPNTTKDKVKVKDDPRRHCQTNPLVEVTTTAGRYLLQNTIQTILQESNVAVITLESGHILPVGVATSDEYYLLLDTIKALQTDPDSVEYMSPQDERIMVEVRRLANNEGYDHSMWSYAVGLPANEVYYLVSTSGSVFIVDVAALKAERDKIITTNPTTSTNTNSPITDIITTSPTNPTITTDKPDKPNTIAQDL